MFPTQTPTPRRPYVPLLVGQTRRRMKQVQAISCVDDLHSFIELPMESMLKMGRTSKDNKSVKKRLSTKLRSHSTSDLLQIDTSKCISPTTTSSKGIIPLLSPVYVEWEEADPKNKHQQLARKNNERGQETKRSNTGGTPTHKNKKLTDPNIMINMFQSRCVLQATAKT